MLFNLLDLFILLSIFAVTLLGTTTGSVRLLCSLGGLLGGLLLGAYLAPHISGLVTPVVLKEIIIFGVILVIVLMLAKLGEVGGRYLARKATNVEIDEVTSFAGSVLSVVVFLLCIWLISNMLIGGSNREANRLINGSETIKVLNTYLPPVPAAIAELERAVDPNGFPQVYTGFEPTPTGPKTVATTSEVAAAVAADQASTVKIQGYGCGGLVSGSGFVVAPDLVMTAAHVVSGISGSVVIDANGSHNTTVVDFDPNLDLAVLKVADLAGQPLSISPNDVHNGTHVVALGYPSGGNFTASAASVLDERAAAGRNIYNSGLTSRAVYEVDTSVAPGNSGGPLVLPDGTVVGVIFAKSEVDNNVGYALTAAQVTGHLTKAMSAKTSMSTGTCAAE
jgi:S1-C subfamily serine protease